MKNYLLNRVGGSDVDTDLLQFPKYLEIETVNACNARCPMCTIDDWERKSPVMTDALFSKIVGDIAPFVHKLNRVSLYRDGEPLLDKRLSNRIAQLKSIHVPEVAIATNVQLLSEEKSIELLESGLDLIIFSIDSLEKATFEKIRARLDFDVVLENARRFIDLRNRLKSSTRIWVRMIRQKDNFNELEAFLKYWSPLLGSNDRVYHHDIFNWGGQLKGYEAISINSELERPCVALWSLLVIFSDGTVPLCNVDYNARFPIGNVVNASIEELWKSKVMSERRDWHLTGNKTNIPMCISCDVWNDSYLHIEEIGASHGMINKHN